MPWEIVTNNSEILAIHAALLPTNQILMFGGSEHNAAQNLSGNPTDLDNTRLFNLAGSPLIETIGSPTTDVFCSGHACLADGRLLVGGGTKEWGGEHEGHGHDLNFLGEHGCWIYHPRARTWRRVRDLNFEPGQPDGGGRWYPTLLTLANGEVLAVAGHPFRTDSRHNNDTPERYSPGGDTWALLTAERLDAGNRTRYYPRFHLLPDGNVFFVSPLSGACRIYDPFTGQTVGSTIPSAGGSRYNDSWDYPSVLLPLLPTDGYKPRVMICGDTDPKKIDLSQASPTWQNTATRTGTASRNAAAIRLFRHSTHWRDLRLLASTAARRMRMRSEKAKFITLASTGTRGSLQPQTVGQRLTRQPSPATTTPPRCCFPMGVFGPQAPARTRLKATLPLSANSGSRSSNRPTTPIRTARN